MYIPLYITCVLTNIAKSCLCDVFQLSICDLFVNIIYVIVIGGSEVHISNTDVIAV